MANRRFIDFPIASTVGDNDIVLIWQDGANKQTTKATILSGLPENLDELNDVVISGLTNGQILRYDSVTGKWVNTDQGNLDLNDLNDVSIVSPSNGQVLVYNSSTSKWENSSGGFVPYVGAVTTVDLGAQGLRAGYVRFDTSIVTVPDEQGLMYWDASRSTAALIMNGTLQHIGQDSFFYVKNSSGSTIPKGTCVGFAGTDGGSGHLLITPFLANGSVPSTYFMGVTSEEITNGSFGQVMHFGELTGINTSGFTAGALLYASSTVAGAFQTTAPVAPNNIILVAAAVNSKNNGAIVVRPTLGSNFGTNESVKLTSVTDKDLLQYTVTAGVGLWENKTLAQVIGSAYVPSTRTLTINGTAFDLSANRSWTVGDVRTDGSYSNPSWITALAWSKITGTPTTLSGYGITDAVPSARTLTINGVTQDLSANRTFNVGTVTSVGLSSATSGVTIGGSPVTGVGAFTLTIETASGSQQGLLSASDWTTFNNKQNALTNPVTGTGTTNYLAKFTGSTTIGNSQIFDNGTFVGIGTGGSSIGNDFVSIFFNSSTARSQAINIKDTNASASGSTFEVYRKSDDTYLGNIRRNGTDDAIFVGGNSYLALGSGNTERVRITSGGNLLVGTTTDNGARLQVSGGNVTITNSGNVFSTIKTTTNTGVASYLCQNDINTTTEIGAWGSTRSGFGAIQPNNGYIFSGDELAIGASLALKFGVGGSNTERMRITSGGNVGIGTSSPIARLEVSGSFGGGGIIRLNDSTSESSIGYRINGSTGSTGWVAGNANNDFFIYSYTLGAQALNIKPNGNVGIGTSSPSANLEVATANSLGSFAKFRLNAPYYNYWEFINNSALEINRGGSTHLTISNVGNLLVGTTTDNGARLQVSGNGVFSNSGGYPFIEMQGGTNQGGGIKFSGSSTLFAELYGEFESSNNGMMIFRTRRSGTLTESLRIASTGAATFSSSVTAGGGGTVKPQFIAYGGLSLGAGMSFITDLSELGRRNWFVGTEENVIGDFVIKSSTAAGGNPQAGNTRLAILNNGNVGIGTSSPGNFNGLSFVSPILDVIGSLNVKGIASNGAAVINIGGETFRKAAIYTSIQDQGPYLGFAVATSGTSSSANDVMRLTSGGNLLVGTTTDIGQRLQVSGGYIAQVDGGVRTFLGYDGSGSLIGTTTNHYFRFITNDTERMRISSGGNVGINTGGTINYKLHINTSGTAENVFGITNGTQTLTLGVNNGEGGSFLFENSNNGLRFGTNAAERMRITSSGNVGIGTTSPGQKLEVNGRIRVTTNGSNGGDMTVDAGGLAFSAIGATPITFQRSDFSAESMRITGGGNVLIGTTTDNSHKLRVNGTGYFDTGIKTGNPVGSTTNDWLLGRALVSGTSTPDRWIRVQIGNLYYDILAVYMGSV